MTTSPLLQFIVVALLGALALWILRQFPEFDATIAKLISIGVYVVVALFLINMLLYSLSGRTLAGLF